MFYDIIAPAYDKINGEVDYTAWADFFEAVIKKHAKVKPELVLDLGSGTGSMTLELASRGYDMTGVDSSCEMLDIARARAERLGLSDKMLWLMQDMTEFELYGTVDLTVSCLDCINHLNPRELDKCLKLMHNYLIPDGLFIFDINGKYKLEEIYGDNSYVFEEADSVITWQNSYSKSAKRCDFLITVFREGIDGRYDRLDEYGREYAYTIRGINQKLKKAGLELIGAYSDFDCTPATDNDERIYFVARCKK